MDKECGILYTMQNIAKMHILLKEKLKKYFTKWYHCYFFCSLQFIKLRDRSAWLEIALKLFWRVLFPLSVSTADHVMAVYSPL